MATRWSYYTYILSSFILFIFHELPHQINKVVSSSTKKDDWKHYMSATAGALLISTSTIRDRNHHQILSYVSPLNFCEGSIKTQRTWSEHAGPLGRHSNRLTIVSINLIFNPFTLEFCHFHNFLLLRRIPYCCEF